MKKILSVLILSIVFTISLFGQTELWRKYGHTSGFISAPDGSTYGLINDVVANEFTYSNGIQRLLADGGVAWTQHFPQRMYDIFTNSRGVFVVIDTIRFYDTTGVLQWMMPLKNLNGQHANTDNDGNLIFVQYTTNGSIIDDSLVSINPNGETLFKIYIPKVTIKNTGFTYNGIGYAKPYDDGKGNIWVFGESNEQMTESSGDYTGVTYLHAFVFSKTTKTLLKSKSFLSITARYEERYKKGAIVKRFDEYFPLFDNSNFLVVDGTFVLSADHSISICGWDKKGHQTYNNTRNWQWLTIKPDLKVKMFSISGTGKRISTDLLEHGREDDYSGVHDYCADANGNVYLMGTFSKGVSTNDVGKYHPELAVIKFDPIKNKILSKSMGLVKFQYSPPSFKCFLTSNNSLFIASQIQNSTRTAYIVDISVKKPSATTISFPGVVVLPYTSQKNTADNFFYAMFGEYTPYITFYLAKYSLNGLVQNSSPKPIDSELPVQFSLSQNYPNPFNPSTVINYSLPVDGIVTLKIYNTIGQEVATLVNEMHDAGLKSVTWDASNMPSGIYYYKLQAGSFSDTKKLLLMK